MKYLVNKLAQFKQWILSIVRFSSVCRQTLELKLKELDLELTNAKNRDIKHLESVAIDLLGCNKNTKDPLTLLYMVRYSALTIDRIEELKQSMNIYALETINSIMIMANKGFDNNAIIAALREAN